MIENITAAFFDLIVAILVAGVVLVICMILCKITKTIYLKVSIHSQGNNHFPNSTMPLNSNQIGFMSSNPISHSIDRDKMSQEKKEDEGSCVKEIRLPKYSSFHNGQ